MKSKRSWHCVVAVLVTLLMGSSADATTTIRVSPGGISLPQALALIMPRTDDVVIEVSGVHLWNNVTIDRQASPDHDLTIVGMPGNLIDGELKHGTAVRVTSRRGECSNVHFRGLAFTGYINVAIGLYGGGLRDPANREATWNGCNSVIGNIGYQVGSGWSSPRAVKRDGKTVLVCKNGFVPCQGYAFLSTQNSRHNHIANNTMRWMGGDHHMHCIYLSNGSTDNRVENNVCRDIAGACYKARDKSDNNWWDRNECTRSAREYFFQAPVGSRPHERESTGNVHSNYIAAGVDKVFTCRKRDGKGGTEKTSCSGRIIDRGPLRLRAAVVRPPLKPKPKKKTPSKQCKISRDMPWACLRDCLTRGRDHPTTRACTGR